MASFVYVVWFYTRCWGCAVSDFVGWMELMELHCFFLLVGFVGVGWLSRAVGVFLNL